MSMSIEITSPEERQFRWTVAAVKWADKVGPMARTRLKEEAPVSTESQWNQHAGRLRDSIRYERKTDVGSEIELKWTAHVPYAGYVVGGTRPHEIKATAARTLRWMWFGHAPGAVAFAKKVHHPGTRPNPFNLRAMQDILPDMQELFTEIMREAMGGTS